MVWYNCSYRGGGISNSQIITEEGKYSLDAVQNNPEVEGSLRQESRNAQSRLAQMEEFYKIRSFDAGAGEYGYIKCVTIKILSTYSNNMLMFEISERGWKMPVQLYILFANSGTKDPELANFGYAGSFPTEIALCKSGISTWDLYVKKYDRYESVCIHRYSYDYLYHKFDISFPDEYTESLPDDAIQTVHPVLYG